MREACSWFGLKECVDGVEGCLVLECKVVDLWHALDVMLLRVPTCGSGNVRLKSRHFLLMPIQITSALGCRPVLVVLVLLVGWFRCAGSQYCRAQLLG